MATIEERHWITMRGGHRHPLWEGVLAAATEAGLVSLTTRVVQIPAPENGQLAVMMARAEFADGRVFEDVGDASPQSATPQLAAASLRLASTRAKGRVLRTALSVGEESAEEVEEAPPPPPEAGGRVYAAERQETLPAPAAAAAAPLPGWPTLVCQHAGCARPLRPNDRVASEAKRRELGGKFYCMEHIRSHVSRSPAPPGG